MEISIEQNYPYLLESFHNSVTGTRIGNVRVVSRTRCGFFFSTGLCVPGDGTVLMIEGFRSVPDMIAFRKEMANPAFVNKVTELGFEWIELRSAGPQALSEGERRQARQ